MRGLSIAVIAGIALGVWLIYAQVGASAVASGGKLPPVAPHYYERPQQSIANLDLLVIYFVPKDKKPAPKPAWQEAISQAVAGLHAFHTLQLQGSSAIVSYVSQEPVRGASSTIEYDTNRTDDGNPAGLRSISRELAARLTTGDLHEMLDRFNGSMPIIYVVYQGVGASGMEGAALLNIRFLTDPQYATYGTSLFTHEFYHTVGVPDGYAIGNDLHSDYPTTGDLMGLGRRRPLERNYLQQETLAGLGI
jgi:hypothetical protein